jgi:hypothetical protein
MVAGSSSQPSILVENYPLKFEAGKPWQALVEVDIFDKGGAMSLLIRPDIPTSFYPFSEQACHICNLVEVHPPIRLFAYDGSVQFVPTFFEKGLEGSQSLERQVACCLGDALPDCKSLRTVQAV